MTTSLYLNKEQQRQFRLIARKLGISEYQLLKLIVSEFLKDPSIFPSIYKHASKV